MHLLTQEEPDSLIEAVKGYARHQEWEMISFPSPLHSFNINCFGIAWYSATVADFLMILFDDAIILLVFLLSLPRWGTVISDFSILFPVMVANEFQLPNNSRLVWGKNKDCFSPSCFWLELVFTARVSEPYQQTIHYMRSTIGSARMEVAAGESIASTIS